MDKRADIIMPSSTRTMSWSHCWTYDGSREILVPWLAYLTEWACRLMSVIKSAWFDARSRLRGHSQRQHTGDGLRERALCTGSGRRYEYSARSAGRRYCLDLWQ